MLGLLLAQNFKDTFGSITAPAGVSDFNAATGDAANGIGLFIFISAMIKISTVVAGLWVLYNFIQAGYMYIGAAGDSGTANKVKDKITMSVMGLVIIVAAYTVIAVLSFVLFGKPDYILNPTISGPTAATALPGGASH